MANVPGLNGGVSAVELQGCDDIIRFQRVPDLHGLEFLHATFVCHSFPRHTHETFAIGVIESSVQATYYKGSTHIATSRDICLVNPGEVHTKFSPHPSGWTYRVFYPEPSLLETVASEMLPRGCGLPHFSSPVIKDPLISAGILSLLKALDLSDVTIERETLLYSVIAQMISRHADRKVVSSAARRIEKRVVRVLLDYLEHHFTENISLKGSSASLPPATAPAIPFKTVPVCESYTVTMHERPGTPRLAQPQRRDRNGKDLHRPRL